MRRQLLELRPVKVDFVHSVQPLSTLNFWWSSPISLGSHGQNWVSLCETWWEESAPTWNLWRSQLRNLAARPPQLTQIGNRLRFRKCPQFLSWGCARGFCVPPRSRHNLKSCHSDRRQVLNLRPVFRPIIAWPFSRCLCYLRRGHGHYFIWLWGLVG